MPDSNSQFCTSIPLTPYVPSFVTSELFRYCNDINHGVAGELGEISLGTQTQLANFLRGSLDPTDITYGKPFTPSIPVPIGLLDLPGEMSIKIWPKDIGELGKGVGEVQLHYQLLRW